MRDVGEGSAVYEGGHPLQCLHQIGHQGVLEQGHHGARDAELFGSNGAKGSR